MQLQGDRSGQRFSAQYDANITHSPDLVLSDRQPSIPSLEPGQCRPVPTRTSSMSGEVASSDACGSTRRQALALVAGGFAGCLLPVSMARAGPLVRPLDHMVGVFHGRVVGSAFVLQPGLAVTNAHVVAGLRAGVRLTLGDAVTYRTASARLVVASDLMDLAVLAVPTGWPAPVPAKDARPSVGLAVHAAGFAARQGVPLELAGAILQTGVRLRAHGNGVILRLPGVRLGCSGGPVLDASGNLVGMVTSIRLSASPRSGHAQSAAFAPLRQAEGDEAFVLSAADIRQEVLRLTA
jgi:S1-C subfamily serine protease